MKIIRSFIPSGLLSYDEVMEKPYDLNSGTFFADEHSGYLALLVFNPKIDVYTLVEIREGAAHVIDEQRTDRTKKRYRLIGNNDVELNVKG